MPLKPTSPFYGPELFMYYKPVSLFSAFNELFYKLLKGILLYAPLGVFAISVATFGTRGWETLSSLLMFTYGYRITR